jgi:class 3 adenylate cyclase
MASLFAATYPERTTALILYGTFARFARGDDFPFGYPASVNERWLSTIETQWGTGEPSRGFAPHRSQDPAFLRTMARFERLAMSPGTASKLFRLLTELDVRDVLPAIQVPTLILHRVGDKPVPVEQARYLGEHIPGAKLVELEGDDHMPFLGDQDALLAEVREFLTGERAVPDFDRVLATILFCDIADSTTRTSRMGDAAWKKQLARFYAAADEKLIAFRGRKLDTAGDGLFAAFDGPARAVRCGAALCSAMAPLDMPLRVGVHIGECEVLGDKYSGIAVHLGARVAGAAAPGEVVVTSTVKELVAGSGIRFDDLGPQSLKGVPEPWRLYRAHV